MKTKKKTKINYSPIFWCKWISQLLCSSESLKLENPRWDWKFELDSICALVSKYFDSWYASSTNWFCSIVSLTFCLSSCSSLIESIIHSQSVSNLKLSICWWNSWRLLRCCSHSLYLNLHLCKQSSSKIRSLHESFGIWFISESILWSLSFKIFEVNLLCNACLNSSLLYSIVVLNQLKAMFELINRI